MQIDFEQCWLLIPVYNGEKHLGKTLESLEGYFPLERVLVVDDGSVDSSVEIAGKYPCETLALAQNMGKGGALYSGFKQLQTKGVEWCITMDADGQHAPADLQNFFNTSLENDCAIIIGQREFLPGVMPPERIFSNRVSTWLVSGVAGRQSYDSQCGYRAYRLGVLNDDILPPAGRFQWESEVLICSARAGWTMAAAPVQTIYEEGGESHIAHGKDTWRFLKMLSRYL
jgi:glycosyltransferase involved in cell wall biosynthesis